MRDDRTGPWGSPVRDPQLGEYGGRTETSASVDHNRRIGGRDHGDHGHILEGGVQQIGRPCASGSGQSAGSGGAPGHKTDNKDAWWLAHLLCHAMVTSSFPPRPQRELRDLTRRRRKLIQTASAEKNRAGKVLEEGNGKLGSVLSDVFGVSGQRMLVALLEGTADAARIASFAKARPKKKIPALIAALEEHIMTDHHRMMIRLSLEHMRFAEEQLAEIDEQIRQKIHTAGYTMQWELLRSLPAAEQNAAALLAEMGPEPAQFPTEKHLASSSGAVAGQQRGAGRCKSSHTNRGNRWLRAALTESAAGFPHERMSGAISRRARLPSGARNTIRNFAGRCMTVSQA